MAIDVRRIHPADGPELKAVRLAALADAPVRLRVDVRRGGGALRRRVVRSRRWASTGVDRNTFLARQDGRTVGIAGGYRKEIVSTEVHLVSVWTMPEVRRSGLGRRLVGAVVDWAADTRATSVGLWVTRGNAPAQLLYESIGFRETGEYQPLPSDPCADEVRMILRLE